MMSFSSKRVLGELQTLGYTEPGAHVRLNAFMARPDTGLVDIRYRPYSRWRPEFNQNALRERYGALRYAHCQELGNVNYKKREEPIVLAAPDEGVRRVIGLLKSGISIMLLCACKDYSSCHRQTAYELIIRTLVEQGETVWLTPGHLFGGVTLTYCACCKRTWRQQWDSGKYDERERCECGYRLCPICQKCDECCPCGEAASDLFAYLYRNEKKERSL